MWDYWLPQHFRSKGVPFHWIDAPFFYHEKHPLHWSQAEWHLGNDWVSEQYGQRIVYGSPEFRAGL
jgi:hypothetical protein